MSEPKDKPFWWQGKQLETMGEIMEAAQQIRTKATAKKFMEAYRAITPHADKNIGYMTGYYSPKTMAKLQRLFEVSHPIFGRTIPTPRQAFNAGKRCARASRSSNS